MRRLILITIILLALIALTAIPVLAQGPQPYGRYVVQPGDTLSSIAARHCTTTQEVYALNQNVIGPNPNAIYPGMVLHVPNRCGGQQPWPPAGNVWDRGPSQHARGAVNGNIYTVAMGDTMFSVARRFGLTVQQLAAANGIKTPWWIFPGQRLVIPGLGGAHPVPPIYPPPCQPGNPAHPCPPPVPTVQPCPSPCPAPSPTVQPCPLPQPCPSPCPPPQICPSPCPSPQPCPSPSPVPKPYITITHPAAGAVLSSTFEVKGTGGGLFEGNVVVRALDDKGVVLAEQATIIQAPNAGTGGSGPWSVMLTVNAPPGTSGRIAASSPGTPNLGETLVNVVYGLVSPEVKVFPPGTCQFQAKQNAPFYNSPNGAQAGTFAGGTTMYQSSQGSKVNGVAWYMFEMDPGSGNAPVWAPVTSIAAYTQGCIW